MREYLEDFNHRVIEARRQLLGGPPVVTPTVEIDQWVSDWSERRLAATRHTAERTADENESAAALGFWRRRA